MIGVRYDRYNPDADANSQRGVQLSSRSTVAMERLAIMGMRRLRQSTPPPRIRRELEPPRNLAPMARRRRSPTTRSRSARRRSSDEPFFSSRGRARLAPRRARVRRARAGLRPEREVRPGDRCVLPYPGRAILSRRDAGGLPVRARRRLARAQFVHLRRRRSASSSRARSALESPRPGDRPRPRRGLLDRSRWLPERRDPDRSELRRDRNVLGRDPPGPVHARRPRGRRERAIRRAEHANFDRVRGADDGIHGKRRPRHHPDLGHGVGHGPPRRHPVRDGDLPRRDVRSASSVCPPR